MAANDPLTPQDPGTGASLTPDVGTEPSSIAPDQEPESGSPATPEVDPRENDPQYWKARYANSTREYGRLRQAAMDRDASRDAAYQAYVARMQAERVPSGPPPPEDAGDILSNEEAAALSDAYLEKDTKEIRRLERVKEQRGRQAAKGEVYQELNQAASTGQRIQSSLSYLNRFPELSDRGHPLTQRALWHYQMMQNDPNYSFVEPASYQIAPGTFVNPHLLRLAVTEAKLEIGQAQRGAEGQMRREQQQFVEPGDKPKPAPAKNEFSAAKHLSDEERAYIKKRGINAKTDYWDHMEPTLKEARIKAGKPLTKWQI